MEEENEVVIVTNVYGDVCIRKARRKRQKILFKELMYDYANNTTLHGLPYVTKTGLTLIEKIFWIITFIASVSMCLFLISKVWFKWQTSPVIVTVSEQLVPVHEVPFPSVTICPQLKCKSSVYNFTHETKLLKTFVTMELKGLNSTINETLQRDYEYLYTTRPTKGWSVEHGYDAYPENHTDPEFYPAPGADGGHPNVVVILKQRHFDRDHFCNAVNTGFKVYTQHPTDLPQSSLHYYAVLHNQVTSMALSFQILNTSETLRDYKASVRQCYFPNDRYLKYFKLYTSSNCRIECLANITEKTCGCVAFHMPYSSGQRICTGKNRICLLNARKDMEQQELSKTDVSKCDCLPACNTMDYEAEILKTDFNMKQYLESLYELYNVTSIRHYEGFNYSKLEMYFKKPRFLSMRRSELFGLIDFLANCGGLLGLFLGFSFLSLVEIFYFLSLRLCCTLKKDLEEEKAQNQPGKEIHIEKY